MRRSEPEIVYFSDEEFAKRVVGDSIFKLWQAVDDLARLRPRRRPRYRVTIFGSARARPGTEAYRHAGQLAWALARLGCDIVTGGGPGLMRAANEGALRAGRGEKSSIGIRVNLRAEQKSNPFVGTSYEHRTFFSRLQHFVLLSDAFLVVTGGIGTTLEAMMIWQLLQVRKIYNTPLVFVGAQWADLVNWARRHMLGPKPPLADPRDLVIPHCVETVEEATAIIRRHREKWAKNGRNGAPERRRSAKGPPRRIS